MIEFAITSSQIVALCSFIAGIWGVWKIVKELKKPSDDLKQKVEKHDELLENDGERLKDIEESNKMVLQCLLVIINHDITGNGIEKLKETRDDLQEFLIKKQ